MKTRKGESSAQESRGNAGESSGLEQLVDQAVSRVLDKYIPANLLKAISAIHAGTTQREILGALLDNAVRYAGRTALFVIKAGAASGWQGRGFGHDEDPIKDLALNISSGVADRAMQSRIAFNGKTNEIDPQFVSRMGAPKDDSVTVLPLVLKEKVAALVYADAGSEGKIDAAALELLVVATSAWLEVVSLRKQSQKEGNNAEPTAPVSTSAPSGEPAIGAGDDAEIHRKGQRFARLLVDEIKLYNQAKVAEGRKNKDLYDRLREDIEKSRATYQKRFGNTAAAAGDYFNQELVHSLAEDDISLMGANFRR